MDIQKLMQQAMAMQQQLQKVSNKTQQEKADLEFSCSAGDKDEEVCIIIDGHKKIKSIKFTQNLQKLIKQDPEIYCDILGDLIMTAFNRAAEKADENNNDNNDDLNKTSDMNNMLKSAQSLLGNFKF